MLNPSMRTKVNVQQSPSEQDTVDGVSGFISLLIQEGAYRTRPSIFLHRLVRIRVAGGQLG